MFSYNNYVLLTEGVNKNENIVFSFCRMNPPTKGHLKLMNTMINLAKKEKAKPILFLSHTTDKKKNPLTYDEKYEIIKKYAPKNLTIFYTNSKNIDQIISDLSNIGCKNLSMVVGSDRIKEFSFINKYLEKYNLNNFKIVSAGERDADDDYVSKLSATKLREYALNGDYNEFKKGCLATNENDIKEIYNLIRERIKKR